VNGLLARGFELFVADARGALTLGEVARRPRVALCFGNERDGASLALRARAAGAFAIPMRGMVESYNVSVAAGIALHQVTLGRPGDLGAEGVRRLRARFLLESVKRPREVLARYLRDRAVASGGG
jgi:tRNA (guanosine-2'-O-)-methyltransferase